MENTDLNVLENNFFIKKKLIFVDTNVYQKQPGGTENY